MLIRKRALWSPGWLELLLLLRLLLLLLMLLLLNLLLLLLLAGKPLNRDADHLLLLLLLLLQLLLQRPFECVYVCKRKKTAILVMGAFSEKEKAANCDGK